MNMFEGNVPSYRNRSQEKVQFPGTNENRKAPLSEIEHKYAMEREQLIREAEEALIMSGITDEELDELSRRVRIARDARPEH